MRYDLPDNNNLGKALDLLSDKLKSILGIFIHLILTVHVNVQY